MLEDNTIWYCCSCGPGRHRCFNIDMQEKYVVETLTELVIEIDQKKLDDLARPVGRNKNSILSHKGYPAVRIVHHSKHDYLPIDVFREPETFRPYKVIAYQVERTKPDDAVTPQHYTEQTGIVGCIVNCTITNNLYTVTNTCVTFVLPDPDQRRENRGTEVSE